MFSYEKKKQIQNKTKKSAVSNCEEMQSFIIEIRFMIIKTGYQRLAIIDKSLSSKKYFNFILNLKILHSKSTLSVI